MWFVILAACNPEPVVETDGPTIETGDTGTAPEPVLTVEQDGFHLRVAWSDGAEVGEVKVNGIEAPADDAGREDGLARWRVPDPCAMLGEPVTVTADGVAVDLQLEGTVGWDPEEIEVHEPATALCGVADGWTRVYFEGGDPWWVDSTTGAFYATPGGEWGMKGSPSAWPLGGWYDVEIGAGASLFVERWHGGAGVAP